MQIVTWLVQEVGSLGNQAFTTGAVAVALLIYEAFPFAKGILAFIPQSLC
jgi:hypothetical protein